MKGWMWLGGLVQQSSHNVRVGPSSVPGIVPGTLNPELVQALGRRQQKQTSTVVSKKDIH